MTGKDNASVNQIQNKLQNLAEGKQVDSPKPKVQQDAKGIITKGVAQDTNKYGTAGAPTKYDPKYCDMLIDFFNIPLMEEKVIARHYDKKGNIVKEEKKMMPTEFPTFMMFAMKIGVNWDSMQEWRKKHPEFSVAWRAAKKIQESNWMRGTMKGQWNAQFAMFIGKNIYGYKDKNETDIKSDGKEIKGLTVGVVSYDNVKK